MQNLRSFVEAFRCQSLSAAARNLNLTQPAVSQHIASLETQLGRPLFERQPRGVLPTDFAKDLAAQIGDGLDRAEAALATMRARSTTLSGVVHIAGPAELMAEKVAPTLRKLTAAGLEIRIHLGGKDALYDALRDGEVDLAFTASAPAEPQLAATNVGTETLLAVAAPAMVTQIQSSSELQSALQAAPYVAYDTDRPLLRQWCLQNNVNLDGTHPAVTAPDIRVLRALVETGVGWSVVPDYLCKGALSNGYLRIIDGSNKAPRNSFYLVWAKSALRHPRVAYARDLLLEGWRDKIDT